MTLKRISKPPNPTGRWVLELRSFDFQIEFRKGKLNVVPDILSGGISTCRRTTELCNAISNDNECSWLKGKKMEFQNNPGKHPEYMIANNNLLRNCGFGALDDSNWKLCAPQALREKVIIENHSNVTAGHEGTRKTINKLLLAWTISGCKTVNQCKSCLENETPQEKPAGLIHTIPATYPWKVVTIDIVGPFINERSSTFISDTGSIP